MPDDLPSIDVMLAAAWPSNSACTGHIPVGLPIPSTAPLTSAEREVLATLARGLDVMAGLVREALGRNRVDLALDAVIRTAGVGDQARSIAARLGRNR